MKNIWIWLVVAVLIISGGYWWLQSSQGAAPAPSGAAGLNGSPNQGNLGGADSGTPQAPSSDTQSTGTGVDVNAGASATVSIPKTVTVTYNGSSYSPKTVTVNAGDTVQFVSTSGSMWTASDPHPQHTGYDGTSRSQHCASGYSGPAPFDQCAPGASFSFVFTKAGAWGYHNHLNDSAFGTVIVQ